MWYVKLSNPYCKEMHIKLCIFCHDSAELQRSYCVCYAAETFVTVYPLCINYLLC